MGKIFGSKLVIIICMLVFRLLCDFVVVNIFGNSNIINVYVQFNYIQYISSWLLYIPCVLLINTKLKDSITIFTMSVALMLLAPMTSLSGLDSNYGFFPIINVVCSYLLVILVYKFSPNFSYFNFKMKLNKGLLYGSITLVLLLLTYFVFNYSSISFNLNMNDVYYYRRSNETVLYGIAFSAYIIGWIYKIINPFLIFYFLNSKNYLLALFFVIAQIIFFGVSNHKSILFICLLPLYFSYVTKKNINLTVVFVFAAILTMLFGVYGFYNYDDPFVSSLLVRRLFFVPASLTYTYFDFFSKYPFAYWEQSLNFISDKSYPEGVVYAIGGYLGYPNTAANNGYVSMGYAHLGSIGVAIYSIILGFTLKIIDNELVNSKSMFGISIIFVPLFSIITSSDLLAGMLTHGLLVAFIYIKLMSNISTQAK